VRGCPHFFRFVCLMEVFYKVNLNPAVAVAYRENCFHKADGLEQERLSTPFQRLHSL
jgi:hypothetical protein